jgi:tetratricopeptide (TPR) repeat protein
VKTSWRVHAAVTVGVMTVFARGVPYPLQTRWDDGRFLVDNPLVREPSWSALVAIVSKPQLQAYHPMHLLSYWLDAPWTGAHAPTLHAVNLLLWTVAANLLLAAWLRIGLSAMAAGLATLAYATHPVQVEAVTWATGRKDVLAALFAFTALVFHLRARTWGDRNAWFARVAFAAAALSKTTALPWPIVLWLVDVCLRGHAPARSLRMQGPSLVLAAVLAPLVVRTWGEHEMIRPDTGMADTALRVANTLAHHAGTVLWPHAVSPMYSTRAVGMPSLAGLGCALAFLGALVACTRGRHPRALFALVASGVLLSPVSNAVPMVFPWQDRYASLPLFGLAFGFALVLHHAAASPSRRARTVALGLGTAAALVLAARTVQYQGAWSRESRLWGHAAVTQPAAYYAWMKLGEVRRESGDLDGAIRAYARMLALEPGYKLGHAALVQAVALRDERIRRLAPSRAEAYARALYDALDDADALRALGARMLATGHVRALEIPLARALDLVPFPDDALARAARTHFRAGRPTVGLFYFERMDAPSREPDLIRFAEAARNAFPAGAPRFAIAPARPPPTPPRARRAW